MRKLHSPKNDAELAVIRSLLEGEKIHYFVHNDHFGSLEVGPRIELYNAKTIMVAEDHYDWATEVINSFVETRKVGNTPSPFRYSVIDKMRMILEAMAFMWFMPGRMRRRTKKAVG